MNTNRIEDERSGQPRRVGQGRGDREQEDEKREHVERALGNHGSKALESRCAGALSQGEHASRLSGARRQDRVEEVTDHERIRDNAERRSRFRGKEDPPANGAQDDRDGEHEQRRAEHPVLAVGERTAERAEVDTSEGEVCEEHRNQQPGRGQYGR
jgi:hypothetical protein